MPKPNTCCCCGQVIPPKIVFQGKVKRRIYEFVSRHPEGVGIERIAEYVYAGADGGPENAFVSIRTTVWFMNKILKKDGLCIRGTRGRGGEYCLRALPL